MRADFSEFSYGFALTYELTFQCWPQITAVPLFPSLLAEADKGYDVTFARAGIPLFLQFKLPEYMTTARALYWSDYDRPHLRLTVYPRAKSNQHNLLKQLAQTEPEVYYAAPGFHRERDFGEYFVGNAMVRNSAFFSLADLPNITDEEPHHITYRSGQDGFRWHSQDDEYSNAAITGARWSETMARRLQKPRELGAPYFTGLRQSLVGMLSQTSPQLPLREVPPDSSESEEAPRVVLRDLAFMLATHLGLEMFLLRPKASAPSE